MGLARNLSKFKPSSDGLVGAEDIAVGAVTADKLGFALSSNALSQSLPLKSGATLTAGRAVNINSSGEVGDYPVVNTLGTLVSNSTSTYYGDVGYLSTDGSRALNIVNPAQANGGSNFLIRGIALTSTGQTTSGTVSLGVSGGYNGYTVCKPINETQFLLAYFSGSGTGYYDGQTLYYYARVVTVDASGNVSLGTADTFSIANGYLGYGWDMYLSPLPSGRFAMLVYFVDNSNTTFLRSRTYTVSGTSLSQTSDTDMNFRSMYPSFLTTNNKLVGGNTADLYYCNYDGSTTSSYASTNLTTSSRGGQHTSILLSASFGLIAYNKTNYDLVLETFSINQTTGVPTTTASYVITNTATAAQVLRFAIISSTEILFSYFIGTTTYILSLKLNANAQIIGRGIPVVANSTGNEVVDIRKASSNTARFLYSISSTGYSRDITINSYDTLSWVSSGATATSQTTSPSTIVVGGVCGGFSGLTPGSKYYVNELTYDGQVTTTVGSYLVGTAISSTEILLG